MSKRRQYTRELLAARAESATAFREGRGPLLRIVAGPSAKPMPVQYAPRSTRDPRPWVQWNLHDGSEGFRYSGRECWAEAVDPQWPVEDFWSVQSTLTARLAGEGLAMVAEAEQGASWLSYVFADGSTLTVSGQDVTGLEESTVRHTVGEHGSLSWQWFSRDQSEDRAGWIPEGEQGADFGRDSAALVAKVVELADEHGRAWQEYASQDLDKPVLAWAEAAGVELPFPPPQLERYEVA